MVGGLGQAQQVILPRGQSRGWADSEGRKFGEGQGWVSLPAPPKDALAGPVTGRENRGRSTTSGRRRRGEAPVGGDRDGRRGEAALPEGRGPRSATRRPPLPPGPGAAAGNVSQAPGLGLPAVSRQPPETTAPALPLPPAPLPALPRFPPQSRASACRGGRAAATVTFESLIYFITRGEHPLPLPSLPACPPRRSPGGQPAG